MKTYPLTSKYTIYEDGTIQGPRTILQHAVKNTGYAGVVIHYNHKRYDMRVHRLLAEAFIPNPLGKDQVNHIDGNKLNNSLDNLEWCTNTENRQHAFRTGLQNANHKRSPVICTNTGIAYPSINQAALSNGISRVALSMHLSGRNKTTGSGLVFKYVNELKGHSYPLEGPRSP